MNTNHLIIILSVVVVFLLSLVLLSHTHDTTKDYDCSKVGLDVFFGKTYYCANLSREMILSLKEADMMIGIKAYCRYEDSDCWEGFMNWSNGEGLYGKFE